MTERKEPFEAGRDAIRNLAEKFAEPTEAEIAAADEIAGEIETRGTTAQSNAAIIHRHNAPLHAKIEEMEKEIDRMKVEGGQNIYTMYKQKSALELAQKAIESVPEFLFDGVAIRCRWCGGRTYQDHKADCRRIVSLTKIKEALK